MKMTSKAMLGVMVMLLLTALPLAAQNDKPVEKRDTPHITYKLEIGLTELDGDKRVNTRKYSMNVSTAPGNTQGDVKIGNRVPVVTGAGKEGGTVFQYLDVGINLSCRYIGDEDGSPEFNCNFEVSSLVPQSENPDSRPNSPVLRQMRGNGVSVTPLDKPVVFATMEDTSSGKRFEVAVTATRVK